MPANDQVSKQLATYGGIVGNVSVTGTGLTGAIIDTKGYESLTWVIQAGAITAGTFTVEIKEGATAGFATSAVVAAGEIIATDGSTGLTGGAALSMTAGSSTGAYQIGDIGKERYHRIRINGDATADGDLAVVAIKGHPRSMPTS